MAQPYTTPEPKTPWLAISFGCCASSRDVEADSAAALRANGEAEMKICYDQPQPISRPRAESLYPRPTTSHSMGRHVTQWVANGRDFATRASSRASIHTLTRPRRSHSKPQSRPSIGLPMDFRHNEGFDTLDGIQSMLDDAPMPVRRRRSFRPLELSIYIDPENRLSDLPDFTCYDWDVVPAGIEVPAQALVRERDSRANSIISNPSTSSYLIQRKAVGSGSRRSSVQSQNEGTQQSRPVSGTLPFLLEESKSRPLSITSVPSTIQRSNTQGSSLSARRVLSRVASPTRARSNTDNSSLGRGSLRRARTDVDDAIRELNTIVEERRASAYRSNTQSPALINRPPLSPSHHVPAIAPSLRMHVRSETLSDIGSAFSAPLVNKSLPTPPPSLSRQPTKLSLSTAQRMTALYSNPITPPTPNVPTPTTPISRMAAWFKRSLPSTPSSPSYFKQTPNSLPQTPASRTPFYQCTPPLPAEVSSSSRPSTADSRTLHHNRQSSNDTATVTLLSTDSYPGTPSLSRSRSPTVNTLATCTTLTNSPPLKTPDSPPTPARQNLLTGTGKPRRVPAPLTLAKDKDFSVVERPLGSARSVASNFSSRSGRASLKPPPSPNYGLLRGMEIPVRPPGREAGSWGGAERLSGVMNAVSPVGVAF